MLHWCFIQNLIKYKSNIIKLTKKWGIGGGKFRRWTARDFCVHLSDLQPTITVMTLILIVLSFFLTPAPTAQQGVYTSIEAALQHADTAEELDLSGRLVAVTYSS